MEKKTLAVLLIVCALSACNSTEDIQKETTISLAATAVAASEAADCCDLNIESINLFGHVTEDEIYNYSERVKGTYSSVTGKEGIIPEDLIYMLEQSLCNSCNFSSRNFMEDILNSPYFETIKALGADDYLLNLESIYQLFPEVHKNESEIDNIYQAYGFINDLEHCTSIFHVGGVGSEEFYIFVFSSGGTNGANRISVAKRNNESFIYVCEFETQNNGYGRVINYGESFYYIFLEYNYHLKNYDGIRIHKLGANADTENVLIKYLPQKYVWKNIYIEQTDLSLNINNYIDSIKAVVTAEQYIEYGNGEPSQLFWGDEKIDNSFPLADEYNQYHKIDFMNTGIPIYIRKSHHEPSNYQSTLYLKAKFYSFDAQTDIVTELEELEIGKQLLLKNELTQMWFKIIGGKVFTFTIHHISDYNYMLNILLIEDKKLTVVRTDIFSPQRAFVLLEGSVFKTY